MSAEDIKNLEDAMKAQGGQGHLITVAGTSEGRRWSVPRVFTEGPLDTLPCRVWDRLLSNLDAMKKQIGETIRNKLGNLARWS